jgi:hypothetical protein
VIARITTFPLARYRFEWRATSPLRIPDYAGSMLRGAFGHALRQLACMTKQKKCDGCALITSCPFPSIFAPVSPAAHTLQKFSEIPVPYIIEPPEWGAIADMHRRGIGPFDDAVEVSMKPCNQRD